MQSSLTHGESARQSDPERVARRNGVSGQVGISNGGFKYTWTYPGDRALGLRQDSKFIWGTIKVKAEILALANGNNQQLARAGPHAHGTRKGSSYKAGEPVGSGSGDSGQSSVAE